MAGTLPTNHFIGYCQNIGCTHHRSPHRLLGVAAADTLLHSYSSSTLSFDAMLGAREMRAHSRFGWNKNEFSAGANGKTNTDSAGSEAMMPRMASIGAATTAAMYSAAAGTATAALFPAIGPIWLNWPDEPCRALQTASSD